MLKHRSRPAGLVSTKCHSACVTLFRQNADLELIEHCFYVCICYMLCGKRDPVCRPNAAWLLVAVRHV